MQRKRWVLSYRFSIHRKRIKIKISDKQVYINCLHELEIRQMLYNANRITLFWNYNLHYRVTEPEYKCGHLDVKIVRPLSMLYSRQVLFDF